MPKVQKFLANESDIHKRRFDTSWRASSTARSRALAFDLAGFKSRTCLGFEGRFGLTSRAFRLKTMALWKPSVDFRLAGSSNPSMHLATAIPAWALVCHAKGQISLDLRS